MFTSRSLRCVRTNLTIAVRAQGRLCGNEQATWEYVEAKQEEATEEPDDEELGKDGQTDPVGQPLPVNRGELF